MRQDLPTQIGKELENLIALKRYQPGDKLPTEFKLAEIFDVNRTTVRQALNMLETRGLIEQKVGKGTFVKVLSNSALSEIIERLFTFRSCSYEEFLDAREIIEPTLAATTALKATLEDLDKLKELLEQIELHYEGNNFEKYGQADVNFHMAIAQASHNELISSFMEGVQKVMLIWVTTQAIACRPNGENRKDLHRAIYKAIIDRNPDRARQSMLRHIKIARKTYRKELLQAGEGMAPIFQPAWAK